MSGFPDERDEPMLPLNSECPHCGYDCDIGEIYDGSSYDCESCGAVLQAASCGPSPQLPNGLMYMIVERRPSPTPATGRQRTRRLWAKRGRR